MFVTNHFTQGSLCINRLYTAVFFRAISLFDLSIDEVPPTCPSGRRVDFPLVTPACRQAGTAVSIPTIPTRFLPASRQAGYTASYQRAQLSSFFFPALR
jgi:hypothetical protein